MQSIRSSLSSAKTVMIRLVDEQPNKPKTVFRIFLCCLMDGESCHACEIGSTLASVLKEVCGEELDTLMNHVEEWKLCLCLSLWKEGYYVCDAKENENMAEFCVSPSDVMIRIKNKVVFWGLLEDFCRVFGESPLPH